MILPLIQLKPLVNLTARSIGILGLVVCIKSLSFKDIFG